MIANFGYGVLLLTFFVALFSIFAAVYGYFKNNANWIESARRAMLLTFPLISLSAAALIYLLVTDHYEVAFVYEVTSRSMPLYLKITAWWGGQAGSLVFWGWLLSAFTSAVTIRKWDRDREFLPWVIVVCALTLAFFLGMVVFYENPFMRYFQTLNGVDAYMFQPASSILITPPDGNGLNPLLRHPGMVIHPPMLYLGFVSFVIPFAFAIAALVTGRTDDRWIRITRRWTLVAWLFLSLGLVLGGRWAYDVLGWGGYWGWDPVEIAAFMPWLTGTAFVHSVMIQEKRGMLKQWNMVLIILTYALVIFGTFLTRSGVLSSVHAFSQSAIGPLFFAFIGLTFVTSTALLLWRWNELKSETQMKSLLSREALFLLNNLLFIGVLIVCFWGVIFPLISEIATGQKVTVGAPFYERANGPLFGALMFLMAIAPLSAWGVSTLRTLGRAIWKPSLVALAVAVWLSVAFGPAWIVKLGSFDLPLGFTTLNIPFAVVAILGFTLVALVLAVTAYEFGRAVLTRMNRWNESVVTAFNRLVQRDRRRYGGYLIHISVMLMALGILGIELFQTETQGTLAQGESMKIAGYTITFDELAQFDNVDNRNITRAVVSVYDQSGNKLTELYPRRDYFYESQQPMTIPGVRSTLEDDLYVLLVDWQPISSVGATFKVYHNPLVNWLWIGTLSFIFGMLIAVWPDKDPEYEEARVVKPAVQGSAAD
jgi:cytochrome c-type biogenesis protein CcmF